MGWRSWAFQLRTKCDRFEICGIVYYEERKYLGMIKKIIIISILSCMGGVGLFLGEAEIVNSFAFFHSEDHPVMKKKLLVKPKSFYSKRRPKAEEFKYEQLSFFPVLNDPSLRNIMGLNGQIIKKINYSPPVKPAVRISKPRKKIQKKSSAIVPPAIIKKASLSIPTPASTSIVSEKTKVAVRQKKTKTVSQILKGFPVLPTHLDRKNGNARIESKATPSRELSTLKSAENSLPATVSYIVQVSSFRTIERAETLKADLEKKGYASFIGQTILPNNKGTWYRVNIGRYLNHAGAEMAATKYYKKEKHKAMVIRKSG
jgi:cell division protein FtsN